jgi:hypothetical protein
MHRKEIGRDWGNKCFSGAFGARKEQGGRIMGIENSKRWHWALAALAVGPMLAFVNLQVEPGASLPTISPAEFEQEVQSRAVPGNRPKLENIVVHHTVPGDQAARGVPVTPVTMTRWMIDAKAGGWKPHQYRLDAETPFITAQGGRRSKPAAPIDKERSVRTVLAEVSAKNPWIKYKNAWWEEPGTAYAVWTGGALAVIGGVWPTVLSLMLGAGLGPQKKEEEYDLDRFGKGEPAGEEKAPEPVAKEMSEADRERLQTQIRALQENVGTAAVMSGAPAPLIGVAAAMAGGPAPIRQLNGGPVESQAPAEKEEEDKEYKGEFYPVARVGGGRKDEEPVGHVR